MAKWLIQSFFRGFIPGLAPGLVSCLILATSLIGVTVAQAKSEKKRSYFYSKAMQEKLRKKAAAKRAAKKRALKMRVKKSRDKRIKLQKAASAKMPAPYYSSKLKASNQKKLQEQPGGLQVSPYVGTTMAWLNFSEFKGTIDETNLEPGLSGGAKLEYVMPKITLETGLLYQASRMSFVLSNLNDTNGEIDWFQSLDHLYVPLTAKYTFIKRPRGTFFVRAGLRLGFLLSAEADLSQDTTAAAGEENIVEKTGDNSESFQSIDFSAILGVGGTTPIGKSASAFLEANFFHGVSDASTVEGIVVRNVGFSVLLGVRAHIRL